MLLQIWIHPIVLECGCMARVTNLVSRWMKLAATRSSTMYVEVVQRGFLYYHKAVAYYQMCNNCHRGCKNLTSTTIIQWHVQMTLTITANLQRSSLLSTKRDCSSCVSRGYWTRLNIWLQLYNHETCPCSPTGFAWLNNPWYWSTQNL